MASASERSIAVADLSQFRRITAIPLDHKPGQVIRAGERLFVTCPEARMLVEIDLNHFTVARKLTVPGPVVSAAVTPDGKSVVLITAQPSYVCIADAGSFRIRKQTPLAETPASLDITDTMAVIAGATGNTVSRVSLGTGQLVGRTDLGSRCAVVRFRNDGNSILAGMPDTKQIVTLDVNSGAVVARLPLAFAPSRFSFNGDGGQMFVTGASDDTLAIVNTYQNEVDQTIVAGRTPYGMAVSVPRNLLLVTNPGSGDLTILDIETRRLSASVHIGGNPGEVLLTPDDEYALVIGREAGDVSVVRLQTVLDHSVKTKPLFTVFPMGSNPQSAAIVPKPA